MAKIYTRTGDDGTTGLIGGERVFKDSPRIEACGTLDELNALLGVVRSHALPDKIDSVLQRVQEDLITIGTEMAMPEGSERTDRQIRDEDIRALEEAIDSFEAGLKPLKQFILPGGSVAGAELHLARTVARRAERHGVALSRLEKVNPQIIRYLNRLSDLCFILARSINRHHSVPDIHPTLKRSGD